MESLDCYAGAFGLDGSLLTGKTLLNLDTEDWGEIFIGCAGEQLNFARFAGYTVLWKLALLLFTSYYWQCWLGVPSKHPVPTPIYIITTRHVVCWQVAMLLLGLQLQTLQAV